MNRGSPEHKRHKFEWIVGELVRQVLCEGNHQVALMCETPEHAAEILAEVKRRVDAIQKARV